MDITNEVNHAWTHSSPRAYFYAKVMRPVYLEFLREDWMDGEELNVVWPNFSLCGTRVAAPNWAAEYSGYLIDPGFQVGGATACSFKHAAREIFVTVHGDDFTITGPEADLK